MSFPVLVTPHHLCNAQLDLPLSEEWLTWQSYVERYGDLVYLKALGNGYLLLASQEAITDLIEKRAHFNSRPYPIMLCKLYVQVSLFVSNKSLTLG